MVASIIVYADPRQGTVLDIDNDPLMVDPRLGTIVTSGN